MAGSIIAGDIVLLALAREDGDAARVKDFHLSLQYSEDRVSQVLKELVRDGWLTMERDEADRRMRKVHASDQLRSLFDEYQRFLFELLSNPKDVSKRPGGFPLEYASDEGRLKAGMSIPPITSAKL